MKHRSKKVISYILTVSVISVAAVWVGGKFIYLGNIEFTDNAQVKQQIVPVNSRVQGYIKEIRFKEYEQVKKGDTLVIIDDAEAKVLMEMAATDLARYEILLTEGAVTRQQYVILAPCDGFTSRKEIQEGQLVQPGQTLLDIVDTSDIWVTANYKETQLQHIVPGSMVEIEVDAVPGVKFNGEVVSISTATGSCLSLLPQDNSAGNFVKVRQRVPVRIRFVDNKADDMVKLRAGMNVECKVKY